MANKKMTEKKKNKKNNKNKSKKSNKTIKEAEGQTLESESVIKSIENKDVNDGKDNIKTDSHTEISQEEQVRKNTGKRRALKEKLKEVTLNRVKLNRNNNVKGDIVESLKGNAEEIILNGNKLKNGKKIV